MSQRPPASIGQRLEEVDTPALVLDLDAFERNLETLKQSVAGKVRATGTNHMMVWETLTHYGVGG